MAMKAALINSNQAGGEVSGAAGKVIDFPGPGKAGRNNNGLVAEYQKTQDPRLLATIVSRNQGLLHTVLKRFTFFPDPYEDLLQVANMGLIKAVQRFDVGRGVEFSSYATAIVDGEVRHYLRDNVLMKQPRWLRRLEKQLEEASIELSRRLKRPPTTGELSEAVNVTEEGILEVLRVYAMVGMHAIDDPVSRESLNPHPDRSRVHSRHFESFSLPIEDRIVLNQALDALSSFQRKIVYLLFYEERTQQEVADEMGMSQRKVSRESAKALERLKAILNTKLF